MLCQRFASAVLVWCAFVRYKERCHHLLWWVTNGWSFVFNLYFLMITVWQIVVQDYHLLWSLTSPFCFWGENALQHSEIDDVVYSSHNCTCHAGVDQTQVCNCYVTKSVFSHFSTKAERSAHILVAIWIKVYTCMFSLLHCPVVCTCKT